nr:GerMN domain-containing protein [uncultured Sellimonas sp.]
MKKKRILAVMLLFLLMISLLAGCGKGDKVKSGEQTLYYLSTDKTELVKVPYKNTGGTTKEQVRDVLHALEEPEEETEDYVSPFQEKVNVDSFVLNEKKLELHFNKNYEKLNKAQEVLLRAAIVQSLVQIKGVSYVGIFIEDKPLLKADGTPMGLMRAEDFVQNVGSSLHSYQSTSLTLYFANKTGDKLVRETVNNVRYNSNISMDKLIIEQLIKGPSSSGAYRTLAENTKVLSVSTKDQICYVNFEENLMNKTSNVKPEVLIYSIVNSIIDSSNVSQVQISVNGESNIDFGKSVRLDKPLSRNLDIVEGEKKD